MNGVVTVNDHIQLENGCHSLQNGCFNVNACHHLKMIQFPIETQMYPRKTSQKLRKGSVFHGQCSAAFQLALEKCCTPQVHLVPAVTVAKEHKNICPENRSQTKFSWVRGYLGFKTIRRWDKYGNYGGTFLGKHRGIFSLGISSA